MTEKKPKELVELHPKEHELIKLIRDLRHGSIKELKIHEGLPDLADIDATQRVKFKGTIK